MPPLLRWIPPRSGSTRETKSLLGMQREGHDATAPPLRRHRSSTIIPNILIPTYHLRNRQTPHPSSSPPDLQGRAREEGEPPFGNEEDPHPRKRGPTPTLPPRTKEAFLSCNILFLQLGQLPNSTEHGLRFPGVVTRSSWLRKCGGTCHPALELQHPEAVAHNPQSKDDRSTSPK